MAAKLAEGRKQKAESRRPKAESRTRKADPALSIGRKPPAPVAIRFGDSPRRDSRLRTVFLNIHIHLSTPTVGGFDQCELVIGDGLDLQIHLMPGPVEGLAARNGAQRPL